MSSSQPRTLSVFAPAKVNLYLHITGRRDDGYHTIDSLAAFADIGDQVHIEPANDFSFNIVGPNAGAFTAQERDASPDSSNLVVKAVWALSRAAQKIPNLRLTLTKTLPLASGLGGGSSDAAATLWALKEWWGLPGNFAPLHSILASLGSDVPACWHCQPVHMTGTGDDLTPAPAMPEIPIVLAHPGKICRTKDVYAGFGSKFSNIYGMPESFDTLDQLVTFLELCRNDLLPSAVKAVPEIQAVTGILQMQTGCRLARMSGSGATCFGLFTNEEESIHAVEKILRAHPAWWVRAGFLGRPERY